MLTFGQQSCSGELSLTLQSFVYRTRSTGPDGRRFRMVGVLEVGDGGLVVGLVHRCLDGMRCGLLRCVVGVLGDC